MDMKLIDDMGRFDGLKPGAYTGLVDDTLDGGHVQFELSFKLKNKIVMQGLDFCGLVLHTTKGF